MKTPNTCIRVDNAYLLMYFMLCTEIRGYSLKNNSMQDITYNILPYKSHTKHLYNSYIAVHTRSLLFNKTCKRVHIACKALVLSYLVSSSPKARAQQGLGVQKHKRIPFFSTPSNFIKFLLSFSQQIFKA
jgi:hypothetical protein